MKRFANWLALGVALGAAACFAAAMWIARPASDAREFDDLVVDSLTKSFGIAPENSETSVSFVFTNRSRRTVHLAGGAGCCAEVGCVSLKNLPVEIPPLESRELLVGVDTLKAGEFELPLMVYVPAETQKERYLTVIGTVVAASVEAPGTKGSAPDPNVVQVP